jgi:hypothetical protein
VEELKNSMRGLLGSWNALCRALSPPSDSRNLSSTCGKSALPALHPLSFVGVEDGLGDLAPLGLEAVPLVEVHVDAVRGLGVAVVGGLGHGRTKLR